MRSKYRCKNIKKDSIFQKIKKKETKCTKYMKAQFMESEKIAIYFFF